MSAAAATFRRRFWLLSEEELVATRQAYACYVATVSEEVAPRGTTAVLHLIDEVNAELERKTAANEGQAA